MISKYRNLLLACVFCLLASLVLAACNAKSAISSAPNVTFTTLQGKQISMDSLKGKVVLVSFWATYCPGCRKEMPDLISTYNLYKNKGLEVIAVAVKDDPPSHVLSYTTENKLPFPVMDDGFGEIASAFGDIAGTPTAFIFDKQIGRAHV